MGIIANADINQTSTSSMPPGSSFPNKQSSGFGSSSPVSLSKPALVPALCLAAGSSAPGGRSDAPTYQIIPDHGRCQLTQRRPYCCPRLSVRVRGSQMRLEAVSFVPPARSVSNSDVVELIRRTSEHAPVDVVTRIGRKVDALLRRSGAVSRHWLGPDEEPLELIALAVSRAFAAAQMDPATVDVLIYASIDRGFIEPANAYFMAQALGLPNVECFDIVDACNGWSRAVQVAQAFFAAGVYRTALIINAEFPMTPGVAVFPTAFDLRSEEELAWSFAAYTLGEGVTASLLSNADASPWTFQSVSRPSQAHLCTVSLPGYARYSRPGVEAAPSGPMRFSSWSTAL